MNCWVIAAEVQGTLSFSHSESVPKFKKISHSQERDGRIGQADNTVFILMWKKITSENIQFIKVT